MSIPIEAALIEERFTELRETAGGVIELSLGCDFHMNAENVFEARPTPCATPSTAKATC
jgi:hypothetical protein